MQIVLIPLINVLITLLDIYAFILFVAIVTSWLVTFRVINTGNRAVAWIVYILDRLTEPVLAPIRRVMPDLGGIDLSPIVVFLLIQLVRGILIQVLIQL